MSDINPKIMMRTVAIRTLKAMLTAGIEILDTFDNSRQIEARKERTIWLDEDDYAYETMEDVDDGTP